MRHGSRPSLVCALTLATLAAPTLAIAGATPASAGTITDHAVINEIYANPQTGAEWVEVYDPTTGPIGATICEVRDDDGNTTDPGCGNMTGEFALRWVDPPFLDDDGETLTLMGTGRAIDTVSYPALDPGESYARIFDGSTRWEIRSADGVTTNASNGSVPIDTDPPELSVSAPHDNASFPAGFVIAYSASDDVTGVARVGFFLRDGASTGAYSFHDQDLNTAGAEPFASIEEVFSLAPGTYDLCVTTIDEAGNGIVGSPDLAACDDTHPSAVAVDDILIAGTPEPPVDPTLALVSPADGSTIGDDDPTLSWTRSIDPGFLLIRQELILSTSSDFTQTPVTYTPESTSFALPESVAAYEATWWWKVVLTFARSSTSPEETVESPAWSFTIAPDTTPADPPGSDDEDSDGTDPDDATDPTGPGDHPGTTEPDDTADGGGPPDAGSVAATDARADGGTDAASTSTDDLARTGRHENLLGALTLAALALTAGCVMLARRPNHS